MDSRSSASMGHLAKQVQTTKYLKNISNVNALEYWGRYKVSVSKDISLKLCWKNFTPKNLLSETKFILPQKFLTKLDITFKLLHTQCT